MTAYDLSLYEPHTVVQKYSEKWTISTLEATLSRITSVIAYCVYCTIPRENLSASIYIKFLRICPFLETWLTFVFTNYVFVLFE